MMALVKRKVMKISYQTNQRQRFMSMSTPLRTPVPTMKSVAIKKVRQYSYVIIEVLQSQYISGCCSKCSYLYIVRSTSNMVMLITRTVGSLPQSTTTPGSTAPKSDLYTDRVGL